MNVTTRILGQARFIKKPPTVVSITDTIDSDAVEEFTEAFNAAVASGQPVIPVVIHSQGGDLFDAMHIIGHFQTAQVPVATIVAGTAYSAAALIFGAGTEGYRFIGPNASIMLHDVGIEDVSGRCNDVEVEVAELKRNNRMAYELMARNAGKESDFFHKKVQACKGSDLYLNAETAVEWGLANHVDIPWLETEVVVNVRLKIQRGPFKDKLPEGWRSPYISYPVMEEEAPKKRKRGDEEEE